MPKKCLKDSKKVGKVFKGYKSGKLKSSSGEKVRSRNQALVIALGQAGLSRKKSKTKNKRRK